MVDHVSRTKARDLIRKFADGQLTNREFDDQYPSSKDRAVLVIRHELWYSWDDLFEHRLEGAYELNAESRAYVDRCIQFLATDLEYTEPAMGGTLLYGIKNAWNGLFGKAAPPENKGDLNAPWWPFSSEEQYRQHTPTVAS